MVSAPTRKDAGDSSTSSASSGVRGLLEGLRIVVVDDDSDARELLAAFLGQRSAEVFTASCAADGFVLLERELPDALISDIAMPEEDGYMLIRRIRALPDERGGRTPAIALTAYAARSDRLRALEAGFDAHFPKPVDIEAVVEKLVDMLASDAVDDAAAPAPSK